MESLTKEEKNIDNTMETFYIGFFKNTDSNLWQKTNLYKNETELKTYMESIPYINSSTITIKLIELPLKPKIVEKYE